MKPDLRVVRLNQTQYWNKDLLPRKGEGLKAIWAHYVYDLNEHTYCCELTPSHWLQYIDQYPEFEPGFEPSDRELEEWDDIMRDNYDEDGGFYAHVSVVKGYNEVDKFPTDAETSEKAIREAIEHYAGNPL